MFGLASTFQRPLNVVQTESNSLDWQQSHHYNHSRRNSITDYDDVATYSLSGSDSCSAAGSSSTSSSGNGSWTNGGFILQHFRDSLGSVLPFSSLVLGTTEESKEEKMMKLKRAVYVYICDDEIYYEGPFKVLQRCEKQFKIDLGEHEDWVVVQRLKPADEDVITDQDVYGCSLKKKPRTDDDEASDVIKRGSLKRASDVIRRSFRGHRLSVSNSVRNSFRRLSSLQEKSRY